MRGQGQDEAIAAVCEVRMPLAPRHASVLFCGLLSLIMVAVVSAVVVAINQGISPDFGWRWLHNFVTAWPVAFPTLLFVAPKVRRLVERMIR